MALLSQLHLAATATCNSSQLRKTTSHVPRMFSCQPCLGLIWGEVPSLRIKNCGAFSREVHARISNSVEERQDGGLDVAMVKEDSDGMFDGLPFKGVEVLGAAAGPLLGAAGPVHAVIKDEVEEMMRFSPEAWINIYLTTGVWLVLYFLVIPLVIYNYLRLRWYKRTFTETYFQFLLVFIFFPGMLLLAPFINFRRLPNDGAEEP